MEIENVDNVDFFFSQKISPAVKNVVLHLSVPGGFVSLLAVVANLLSDSGGARLSLPKKSAHPNCFVFAVGCKHRHKVTCHL